MPSRSLTNILLSCLLVLGVLCSIPITVQTQSTASIEGRVVDQTGAVVAAIEVRATSRQLAWIVSS